MTIVVYLGDEEETRDWVDRLRRLLPEREVRPLEDPGNSEAVTYAVVWAPPRGAIAQFPRLKAVVSVGAGIDHVLRDPDFPRHLPILRTTGPEMVQRLREYVALHVLAHHRRLGDTDANQKEQVWQQIVVPTAQRRRVGLMGLGHIGGQCASTVSALGFDVAGWSRSPKTIPGVVTFAGASDLESFLERTEILICLLPLTAETQDILNTSLFERLPRGASLINAGRGGHLVEADLLAALEHETLSAATLDVFRTEPLPADHPFWTHPKIRVTPHIASYIDPETGAGVVAANIERYEDQGSLPDLADGARGY